MDQLKASGKPFDISKQEVWDAWIKVKGNQAAFLPAVSREALKKMSTAVRSWRLHRRINSTEADLARMINPIVRGWMAYYGAFYHTELTPVLDRINTYLLRWIMKKYRKSGTLRKARQAMAQAAARRPRYFAHWIWVKPAVK